MKVLGDAVSTASKLWELWTSINNYMHTSAIDTSAMEKRIQSLESVITIHQYLIGLLSVAFVVLFAYVLRNR